jgi:hypothetical protein
MGFSNISTAQQFKHLKVDTTNSGRNWILSLPITFGGVNKLREDLENHIPRLGFNAIHSFPQEIKKELIKYEAIFQVLRKYIIACKKSDSRGMVTAKNGGKRLKDADYQ